MAKVASRTRVSAPVKQPPQTAQNNVKPSEHGPHVEAIARRKSPKSTPDTAKAGQSPKPFDPRHLLTMSEAEGMRVYEARCMLKLLEDIALLGEHELIISRGAFAVMMSTIREKLAFSARLIAIDGEDLPEDEE